MRLITILNSTQDFKSFVFKKCSLKKANPTNPIPMLEITVRPRKGSKPVCSKCKQKGPGYDRLPLRHYQHIPFWGFLVFFLYAPRRLQCPRCGIIVEAVPWANGKSTLTTSYCWFLASWARRLSWQEVANSFKTSWHHVFTACRMAVEWGRKRMNLDNIRSIGIDEVKWHKGKKFLTVVYQIDPDCKRLLWVARGRSKKTLAAFFKWLGQQRTANLKFVCSDIWLAYIEVVKEKVQGVLHVLDRFHIVAMIQKAIDQVRAQEARVLKDKGKQPVLKKTKWVLLKKPEKLTQKEGQKLTELLKQNLKTVKCYLLKESFKCLWEYTSPYWAGKFIDRWTRKVMYSKIEPMKKVARTIRKHKPLILNWFRAKKTISQGVVEGFNNKLKLTFRKSYGFRTFGAAEIQLYHALGDLPTPDHTHKFF